MIDITRPLYPGMAVWPGDTEYSFELNWAINKGSTVNVGTLMMSSHTGTHVDAPFHFEEKGRTMEQLHLLPFIGKAKVIHVPQSKYIDVEVLSQYDLKGIERLLIRTDEWAAGQPFPKHIPTLTRQAIDYLAEHKIVLVGLDVPSVDELDSKGLDNHHLLHKAHICIIESLDLSEVQEGLYELIALPLKVVGGDGSPVRAILRQGS